MWRAPELPFRSLSVHRDPSKGNVVVDPDDLQLTREIAAAILGAKTEGVSDVQFLRRENHSWRVVADGSAYYVKAHTKDWYEATPASSLPVRHEVTGYRLLGEAGLPTASVVGYSTSTENPLGWPYLITRELEGAPLVELLPALSAQEADAALRAVGAYLSEMHTLTYEHPGTPRQACWNARCQGCGRRTARCGSCTATVTLACSS
jgi:hypothetical protein